MSQQLALFSWPDDLPVPDTPDAISLLRGGAALVLSVSGGKDSDAMCYHLLDLRQREGWSGEVALIHADLGRAEWHSTRPMSRDSLNGWVCRCMSFAGHTVT